MGKLKFFYLLNQIFDFRNYRESLKETFLFTRDLLKNFLNNPQKFIPSVKRVNKNG